MENKILCWYVLNTQIACLVTSICQCRGNCCRNAIILHDIIVVVIKRVIVFIIFLNNKECMEPFHYRLIHMMCNIPVTQIIQR